MTDAVSHGEYNNFLMQVCRHRSKITNNEKRDQYLYFFLNNHNPIIKYTIDIMMITEISNEISENPEL